MCRFDLILPSLVGSVIAEGFDTAHGQSCRARLVEGLCEDVGSGGDLCVWHFLVNLIRTSESRFWLGIRSVYEGGRYFAVNMK